MRKQTIGLVLAGVMLGGCASVEPRAGFDAIGADVSQRLGEDIHWRTGGTEDQQADSSIAALLDQPLTADAAVQMALLNNRRLQATYEELGIAQADLVQAGLLRNPVFSGSVTFPIEGGTARSTLSVAQSFLDVFYVPLRQRVAEAEFEATRHRVANEVLELAARTRATFYRVQADQQTVEMFEQVTTAASASLEVMHRLHEAGNVSDLDLHREQALFEQARLELTRAQSALEISRERATVLMGLWGEQIVWETESRLPDLPEQEILVARLEQRAVANNLLLAAEWSAIAAAGERLGFTEATALLQTGEIGAEAEREEGEWLVGPELSVPVPIFDQGQARTAEARARWRQRQHRYAAAAIEVRSAARTAAHRVHIARQVAEHRRDVLLPLHQRIYDESLRQFNAVEVSLLDLITARSDQMRAGQQYIESLYDYWTARTRLEQVLAGGTPSSDRFRSDTTPAATMQPALEGGH